MFITIVGCRPYDFKDSTSDRQVRGMKIFYHTKADPVMHRNVFGDVFGETGISDQSPVYTTLYNHDYGNPIKAEVMFDVNPMTNRPFIKDFRIIGVDKSLDVEVDNDPFVSASHF